MIHLDLLLEKIKSFLLMHTGMSVSPEVIVARQVGLRVLAMSLVTNACAMDHDTDVATNHEEVLEVGRNRAKHMQHLVSTVVSRISK